MFVTILVKCKNKNNIQKVPEKNSNQTDKNEKLKH